MKTYKQLVTEAKPKVKWTKEWSLTNDSKGNKVYDWETEDGEWKLTMSGYYNFIGRSHPTNKWYTSWMVTQRGHDPENKVHKTLAAAKKYVASKYE